MCEWKNKKIQGPLAVHKLEHINNNSRHHLLEDSKDNLRVAETESAREFKQKETKEVNEDACNITAIVRCIHSILY